MAEEKRTSAQRGMALSEPFWAAADAGRFLLQRDLETGNYQFFPRPVSLWGKRHTPEWSEASGLGTLVAVTRSTVAAPGFEDEVPYWLAIARLDEGPRVFAQVVGGTDDPQIGDRVRIIWADASPGRPMFRFERIA